MSDAIPTLRARAEQAVLDVHLQFVARSLDDEDERVRYRDAIVLAALAAVEQEREHITVAVLETVLAEVPDLTQVAREGILEILERHREAPLAALAAVEQWIEPLAKSDDPEQAEAVRSTPDYVLMTRKAADMERNVWQKRLAVVEQERDGLLRGQLASISADHTGHLFRCARVNGVWQCTDGCAIQRAEAAEAKLAAVEARGQGLEKARVELKCLTCGHVHYWDDEGDVDYPWGACRSCACKVPNYRQAPPPTGRGQGWRQATAEEQEPLVERLGVMMYEIFEAFAPEPQRPDESIEQFAQRLRLMALNNIRAALRQVLVVSPPPTGRGPGETSK